MNNQKNNASTEEYDLMFKILLLGDSGVGKSSLLLRYTKNEFISDLRSTIGVEFALKYLTIDNFQLKVQIWDTAGMERYRSITNAYYKGAKGSLLVYDITNPKTFENVEKWLEDLKANGDENASVILIGNKNDLESERKITTEQGKEKAEFFKMAFMETSALNGNNIENAFNQLISDVYKNHHTLFEKQAKVEITDKVVDLENSKKDENKEEQKKKGWCCF